MATYAWDAAWVPVRFAMFVRPNERFFPGYYSGQSQATDLLGERWRLRMQLPPDTDLDLAGDLEAFFDRLLGRVNTFTMWNHRRPVPRGTMRGTPTLAADAAQLATSVQIQTTSGATLVRGDMIGFGGQVSRVMADATANGSGVMTVSIMPRVRAAQTSGATVLWDKPTVEWRLSSGDGVPLEHSPGYWDGPAIEAEEA